MTYALVAIASFCLAWALCSAQWKHRTRKCVGCQRIPDGVRLEIQPIDCETAHQMLDNLYCEHDFVNTDSGETCFKCGLKEP